MPAPCRTCTSPSSSSRASSSARLAAAAPRRSPIAGSGSRRPLGPRPRSLTAEPRRTADFDYQLPPELIAQQPLAERSASRLLMVLRADRRRAAPDRRTPERGSHNGGRRDSDTFRQPGMLPGDSRAVEGGVLVDSRFAQLPSLIPAGDLLVLNTTRVRHARLLGTRASGAPAEVLLIHPAADDTWVAMGKPGSALQPGKQVALDGGVSVETVEVLPDGHRRVRFVGATAEQAIAR